MTRGLIFSPPVPHMDVNKGNKDSIPCIKDKTFYEVLSLLLICNEIISISADGDNTVK